MDSVKRSWTKAVLWNLFGLLSMSLIGRLITGSFIIGGTLALINTCVGFVLYLVYERIWARVSWGLK